MRADKPFFKFPLDYSAVFLVLLLVISCTYAQDIPCTGHFCDEYLNTGICSVNQKSHDDTVQKFAHQSGLLDTTEIIRATEPFNCWKCNDSAGNFAGYLLYTPEYIESIGYGGPLEVWFGLDKNGQITGAALGRNVETPGFIRTVDEFLLQFKNTDLKTPLILGQNIDAMTRATISSAAILKAVSETVKLVEPALFQVEAQTETVSDEINTTNTIIVEKPLSDKPEVIKTIAGKEQKKITFSWLIYTFLRFLLVFSALLIAIGRGGRKSLLTVSLISVFLLGFSNAAMLTTASIISAFKSPTLLLTQPFGMMPIMVLITTFLFGWLYCATTCPLGHLLRWLRNISSRLFPSIKKMDAHPGGRSLPIIIPLSLLITAAVGQYMTGNAEWLYIDPFAMIFTFNGDNLDLLLAIFVLISGILVPRFWCRFLCPVGGTVRLLSRYSPSSIRLNGFLSRGKNSNMASRINLLNKGRNRKSKVPGMKEKLYWVLTIVGIILMLIKPLGSFFLK